MIEEGRPIAVLPPGLAQRIAAGEVIDRPSAVVRELVENALDAGARSVDVAIRGAGLESITVSDDGHGIPAGELHLAFARHGTSKVRDMADLDAISTLGFRGEALPSIVAVACVTVTTAVERDAPGARLVMREGQIQEQSRVARTVGTTVEVRELFAGQPVRRGFLPSPRAETAQILSLMRRYVLAWPEVRFVVTLDGRAALRASGLGEAGAMAAAFATHAARMAPFGPLSAHHAEFGGYLGDPGLTRGDREGIILICNRRWVTPARWLAVLEGAYRPLLKPGRHPVLVVKATIEPRYLDVNLHPAKLEVRLADEDQALTALGEAVKAHLGRMPPRAALLDPASGAPRQAHLALPRRRLAERTGEYGSPDPGRLHVLGQVHGRLIVAVDDAGLYLIDQHRADERAIYQSLAARHHGSRTQELLQPVQVELRPEALAGIETTLPELARMGFRCERFGRRAFLVRAIPMGMPEAVGAAIAAAVDEVATAQDWRESIMISVACRSAVRRGTDLTGGEMRALLDRLGRCASPAICPHGSPIIARVGAAELARHFEWR